MITVTGLGPGSLDRVPKPVRELLVDDATTVVVRTAYHPAAAELADLREVVFCDDIYEESDSFDDVYDAIARRVMDLAADRPVIYAVPGSPMVGEFAVRRIIEKAGDVEVISAESFVDVVLAEVGYDPLGRGLQILNGHDLADPLVLDKPTIIAHLDRAEVLADVLEAVSRVVPEDSELTLLSGLGAPDEKVITGVASDLPVGLAGFRTSLFVDSEPGGLIGAVQVMRRLREECPWDRSQTHHSLMKYLIEESYELYGAIGRLPEDDVDWVAYSAVEDELGDVLLQVLFHEAIARQRGAFDIDGAAEVMRQKLVRRHPHVFGDVVVADAAEVKRNWDRIKSEENGRSTESALDGVPEGMPGLQRAAKVQNRVAKVGFDWEEASQVVPKLREEIAEVEAALDGSGDPEAEMGDLLFSVVNLSRHLGIDPEMALRRSTATFEERFRRMEEEGPLEDLGLEELNRRWQAAKSE